MERTLVNILISGSLGLFLASAVSIAADNVATPPTTLPTQIGDFEITFKQRSPLSDYNKLKERFGADVTELGPDYDLADQPFLAYVPADPGSKPFGLVVLSNQDGLPSIDYVNEYRDILDEHHAILVGTKKDHLPFATNAGVCLDAVYNFEQRYPIDRSRIYLIGLSKYIEPIGICTGDVFTADTYAWWPDYFRKIGTMAIEVKYKPPPALLRLANKHLQLIAPFPYPDVKSFAAATIVAMHADGFEHVVVDPVDHDNVLSQRWFEEVLTAMDSVHPPSTRPAPAPPDEPQQLLNLAQAYIKSGLTDRARNKLDLLIQKYPNDPTAEKAKELLSQMNSQ